MKNPCEARKIKASQNLHKIISTHHLTVLIMSVILHLEQRKGKRRAARTFPMEVIADPVSDFPGVLKKKTES